MRTQSFRKPTTSTVTNLTYLKTFVSKKVSGSSSQEKTQIEAQASVFNKVEATS
jgi:hypothetical protein